MILGFNLFTHDVGPAAQRAPEHSEKFNSTVKLLQTMAGVRGENHGKEKMTIEVMYMDLVAVQKMVVCEL